MFRFWNMSPAKWLEISIDVVGIILAEGYLQGAEKELLT